MKIYYWGFVLFAAGVQPGFAAGVFECDPDYLKNAYDKQHTELAAKYAIYGLMSFNTYEDVANSRFVLPDYWKKMEPKEDKWLGLAFDVYEKRKNDVVEQVVIAFRGTEDKNLKDWFWGNFSSAQYKKARALIGEVVTKYKGVPIVSTGHSLGGGLAMFASYRFDGVTAVGFNASPRYHSKSGKKPNTRVIIYERGDPTRFIGNILYPWRWRWIWTINESLWRKKKWDILFVKYNFTTGLPIANHSSYALARGVLMLGSLVNPELTDILRKNCDLPSSR